MEDCSSTSGGEAATMMERSRSSCSRDRDRDAALSEDELRRAKIRLNSRKRRKREKASLEATKARKVQLEAANAATRKSNERLERLLAEAKAIVAAAQQQVDAASQRQHRSECNKKVAAAARPLVGVAVSKLPGAIAPPSDKKVPPTNAGNAARQLPVASIGSIAANPHAAATAAAAAAAAAATAALVSPREFLSGEDQFLLDAVRSMTSTTASTPCLTGGQQGLLLERALQQKQLVEGLVNGSRPIPPEISALINRHYPANHQLLAQQQRQQQQQQRTSSLLAAAARQPLPPQPQQQQQQVNSPLPLPPQGTATRAQVIQDCLLDLANKRALRQAFERACGISPVTTASTTSSPSAAAGLIAGQLAAAAAAAASSTAPAVPPPPPAAPLPLLPDLIQAAGLAHNALNNTAGAAAAASPSSLIAPATTTTGNNNISAAAAPGLAPRGSSLLQTLQTLQRQRQQAPGSAGSPSAIATAESLLRHIR